MNSRRYTPLRAVRLVLILVACAATPIVTGCGPELGPVLKLASISAPALPELSDPAVVRVHTKYYIYGSNNHFRAPITSTYDPTRPMTLSAKNRVTSEGMPGGIPWAANSTQLWAPTVGQFGGRWAMFFAADRRFAPQPNNPQCIGRAWANSPAGPFVAEAAPFTCGLRGAGGALDPQLFTDWTGQTYLLAAFGDTESPLHTIALDPWGNQRGPAVELLRRQHNWEYHFIENPAMIYDYEKGNYLLAYSAGRWWESRYSTGIARCATPTGPCTSDPSGPWVSSSNGRSGPGGMSFYTDTTGQLQAIFATFRAGGESQVGGRSGSIMRMNLVPTVSLGTVTK